MKEEKTVEIVSKFSEVWKYSLLFYIFIIVGNVFYVYIYIKLILLSVCILYM